MKNCDPFVFGPEFAMLRIPAPVCFNAGWISSANFSLQVSSIGRPRTRIWIDRHDRYPFYTQPYIFQDIRVASLNHEIWYYSVKLESART
jgi:hypothetical protein